MREGGEGITTPVKTGDARGMRKNDNCHVPVTRILTSYHTATSQFLEGVVDNLLGVDVAEFGNKTIR